MRFEGERRLAAPVEQVHDALHDAAVLRRAIPACQELAAVGPDHFLATLAVQVGPFNDTYRGMFSVADTDEGLRVTVDAHGRRGRLTLDLRTGLIPTRSGTRLRYVADATVGGLVARLGGPALSMVGARLTTSFFHDLERALSSTARRTEALV